MANPADSATLAEFEATVHRTKNRLIAIPAAVQARLGLTRRAENHIVRFSIRPATGGRWHRDYGKLTFDNELAAPQGVPGLRPGVRVQVRLHRFSPDVDALAKEAPAAAAILSSLSGRVSDDRVDGSLHVDDYLRGEA